MFNYDNLVKMKILKGFKIKDDEDHFNKDKTT